MVDSTERTTSRGRGRPTRVDQLLFLVLDGGHLDAGGLRVSLANVDELTIGRGAERALQHPSKNARVLTVPDARMSTVHARLVRRDGAYHLRDADSTNGTLRNGAPVGEACLRDGDVLELGQTLFVYREMIRAPGQAAAGDLASSELKAAPFGLATLDPVLAARFSRLARVASSSIPTLLLGETGTGKEVLARAIHQLSKRPGPFAAVNCGAIPHNLVESHLFGHVKGSFSGAVRDDPGLVRSANFGTLLLDEIGDLPASSQAALLRVLQEGEVLPVGSTQPIKVDVRIVSATHRPLDVLVERGDFRRDLYGRLAGFTFALPPLRERLVDLGSIVAALQAAGRLRIDGSLRLHHEAGRAMLRHDWPMNVRELEQCLRTSSVLSEDGVITVAELPPEIADALADGAIDAEDAGAISDDELRRELLVKLAESNGNVSDVARRMGKARQQVQRWLRRLDIDPDGFREK